MSTCLACLFYRFQCHHFFGLQLDFPWLFFDPRCTQVAADGNCWMEDRGLKIIMSKWVCPPVLFTNLNVNVMWSVILMCTVQMVLHLAAGCSYSSCLSRAFLDASSVHPVFFSSQWYVNIQFMLCRQHLASGSITLQFVISISTPNKAPVRIILDPHQ
jgi:hypothetical protein